LLCFHSWMKFSDLHDLGPVALRLKANGPAVGFSKRYPTTAPPRICPDRLENCHGARRVRCGFCRPGTKFDRRYACRGTSLIGAGKLSRYCYFINSTGAASRYKFNRSQKTVKVQNFYCVQMNVSRCKFWLDLSWEQGLQKP